MDVITWQQPSRVIPPPAVQAFYDSPLSAIHAFLFETGQLELPQHRGSFSVKLVLAGEEEYFVGRRTIRLRPGDLLLMNAGESYASRIRHQTRSLALFFPASELADTGRCLATIEVPQCRFTPSPEFSRQLSSFLQAIGGPRAEAADEWARCLLVAALTELNAMAPVTSLAGVRKAATRDELIGRVVRAREFIDDMNGIGCSLDRLAGIACLSKYHFLRVFKEVFGCGPAAYARSRRQQLAARKSHRRHGAN